MYIYLTDKNIVLTLLLFVRSINRKINYLPKKYT